MTCARGTCGRAGPAGPDARAHPQSRPQHSHPHPHPHPPPPLPLICCCLPHSLLWWLLTLDARARGGAAACRQRCIGGGSPVRCGPAGRGGGLLPGLGISWVALGGLRCYLGCRAALDFLPPAPLSARPETRSWGQFPSYRCARGIGWPVLPLPPPQGAPSNASACSMGDVRGRAGPAGRAAPPGRRGRSLSIATPTPTPIPRPPPHDLMLFAPFLAVVPPRPGRVRAVGGPACPAAVHRRRRPGQVRGGGGAAAARCRGSALVLQTGRFC